MDKFNLDKIIHNMERTKRTLLVKLSEESKKHFINENFRRQQFNGEAWPQPQRQLNSETFGKTNKNGKLIGGRKNSATLVQSATLRRAVLNMTKEFTGNELTLRVNDVPYARVHNEGLTVNTGGRHGAGTIHAKVRGSAGFVNGKFTKGKSKTVKLRGKEYVTKAGSFKMPKRQFVGHDPALGKKQEEIIKSVLDKIWGE